jgi:ubiquinone/menaquinone biosynthesis C-methylase UbiE
VISRHKVFDNPLSAAKFDRLIEALQLPRCARVLDIATGKGEMLCRLAVRYEAQCTGVERSPYFCDEARAKAKERGVADRVTIVQQDGADFMAPDASFDAAMCIGAEWVFGGFEETLWALSRWAIPGGTVVAGTPHWTAEPPEAYLQARGIKRSDFTTKQVNVAAAEALGMRLVYHVASSEDDWDEYDGASWLSAYDYVREHPEDADNAEIIERTEQDKASYFTPGRETLGWATYVFRKP